MAALTGAPGAPSQLVIQVVMVSTLLVNCLIYTSMLHVIYAIMLKSLGYDSITVPEFIKKRLLPAQYANSSASAKR